MGRNGGMAHEPGLGARREESGAQIVVGPVGGEYERRIGVVELARNRKHLGFVEAVCVQNDPRRIAGEGRAGEGIDLMNLDTAHHRSIPRPRPKGGRF